MLFKRSIGNGKKSTLWTARFTAANGTIVQRPTGCRSKVAAQRRLSEWLDIEEKKRAGILTESEARAIEWISLDIAQHIEDYGQYLSGLDRSPAYVKKSVQTLHKASKALSFKTTRDFDRSRAERWLLGQPDMSARSHNLYATTLICFGNWLRNQGRVVENVFHGMRKRNERLDRRRIRRVLSDDEIVRLLAAARMRPLETRLSPGITEKTLAARRWLGETRATVYETLLSTGLRYSELRSIRIGDCYLTESIPYMVLAPQYEKNRQGSEIPVPAEFAVRLEQYRLERIKRLAGHDDAFLPQAFDNEPLFELPRNMVRAFNGDLVHAGIATVTVTRDAKGRKKTVVHKEDAQGRTLDIHALRHTFCDRLVKSGVSVATAQKAMRHSDPRMTLGVYGHIGLQETSEALNRLPKFSVPPATAQAVNCGAETSPPAQVPAKPSKTSPQKSLGRKSAGSRGVSRAMSLKLSPPKRFLVRNRALTCIKGDQDGKAENRSQPIETEGDTQEKDGGPCRIRACDQVIMSHLL